MATTAVAASPDEPKRFSRRRQIRESRKPLTPAPVEGEGQGIVEGPVFEDGPAVKDLETVPSPSEIELERPPGPAVVWQRFREVERKVEVLWLARENEIRLAGRSGLITWRCRGNPDKPLESCDFVMESTPPGQAKIPPLICSRHGKVPFEPA